MKDVKGVSSTAASACCVLLGLLASVCAIGCSGGSHPDYSSLGLVEVSGKVTLDGKPVQNAAICFYEPDGMRFSYGMTDSNGNYELMFNSKKRGVTPGVKSVEISTVDIPLGANQLLSGGSIGEEDDDAKKSRSGDLIPAKYNRDTVLRINIHDSNSHLDFDLQAN